MKTISFKFKTNNDEFQKAISEDSRVCSSMRRFAFNRFKEGKTNKEVYTELGERFSNVNSHLRNSAMRSGASIAKSNEGKKVYFGSFKN